MIELFQTSRFLILKIETIDIVRIKSQFMVFYLLRSRILVEQRFFLKHLKKGKMEINQSISIQLNYSTQDALLDRH